MDPLLADPRMLDHRVNAADKRQALFHLHSDLADRQGAGHVHNQQQQHAVEGGGNIDLNMPLMQLFLQTFLPWNNVDQQPAVAENVPNNQYEE